MKILQDLWNALLSIFQKQENGETPELDIMAILKLVEKILQTTSEYTSTTLDDQVLKFLRFVLQNPTLQELIAYIVETPAVTTEGVTGPARTSVIANLATPHKEELTKTLESAGFSWETLITILPYLVRLVLTVLGKR